MSGLNNGRYVSIINAGGQTDYLYGLVSGLTKIPNLKIEVIDSDQSEGLFDSFPNVFFYNLRGDQNLNSPFIQKTIRILKYYFRLIRFAAKTRSSVFHIQWENKFLLFDRFLLSIYYKLLRKKIVFTAHNIDTKAREGQSTFLNRLSLRFFYWMVDTIIVHTKKMKTELAIDFGVKENKVKIIPHGINNRVAANGLSQQQACSELNISNISNDMKIILFFGYIRPSKGLDVLVRSLNELVKKDSDYKLIVAGSSEFYSDYFREIKKYIEDNNLCDHVVLRNGFIEDSAIERYFMAADCLILPYKSIFQTGVTFLSYRFGLPVITTDVGQLRDDIVEGVTGYVCQSNNVEDLADKIEGYFQSEMYNNLSNTRKKIYNFARERYSWDKIAVKTSVLYHPISL